MRMCIDYREMNKNEFPLLRIEDLFDYPRRAKMFSKFDLQSGYHQLKIKSSDKPKSTFQTGNSHYKFIVMPFGLTNTPSMFMNLMNRVFHKFLDRFVMVFIEDTLKYLQDEDQHKEHLRMMLETVRNEAKFKV